MATAPEVNVHIPTSKTGPCSSWVEEPGVGSSAAHFYYHKAVRKDWRRNMYHHHYQFLLFSQLSNNFSTSNKSKLENILSAPVS